MKMGFPGKMPNFKPFLRSLHSTSESSYVDRFAIIEQIDVSSLRPKSTSCSVSEQLRLFSLIIKLAFLRIVLHVSEIL